MAKSPSPLDSLEIASPCSASWEQMKGDEKVRFCTGCRKKVYALSSMTRKEAESILLHPGGSPCVRFFQRADGTVLTSDCPVGQRRVKWAARQTKAVGLASWALIVSVFTWVTAFGGKHSSAFASENSVSVKSQERSKQKPKKNPPVDRGQALMGAPPPPSLVGSKQGLPPQVPNPSDPSNPSSSPH